MGAISSFLMGRAKGMGGSLFHYGTAGIGGVMSYNDAVDQGDSKEMATLKAGAETMGWIFAEPFMWGMMAYDGVKEGVESVIQAANTNRTIANRMHAGYYFDKGIDGQKHGYMNGKFVDSQDAQTLRQRQMQLLQQSKIATENILGSEARQLHR